MQLCCGRRVVLSTKGFFFFFFPVALQERLVNGDRILHPVDPGFDLNCGLGVIVPRSLIPVNLTRIW